VLKSDEIALALHGARVAKCALDFVQSRPGDALLMLQWKALAEATNGLREAWQAAITKESPTTAPIRQRPASS